jgi:7-carboxy-7-deazaguanine synthase
VKFVICDRGDYEWARFKLDEYGLARARLGRAVLAQPRRAGAAQLAEWILEDRLPVRLQLQLHKLLWDDEPGH